MLSLYYFQINKELSLLGYVSTHIYDFDHVNFLEKGAHYS